MDTVLLPPTCPTCGAAIPADAPQGLCPRCALGGAAAPTDAAPARGEPPPLDSVRAAFPQLEILGLLGAGGMGFVFKARQPHLDRLVALKLLPVPLAADPHFSERFLREGRLLARLTHPGIVTVYDFGQAGGFAYLLMEYVDGVNLRQAMAAGRFTPAEALAVVPKICEALQYAHGRGVLHRDIKPENLLLDAQGRVKIADFGIAKLVGDPARGGTLTGSGARLGTPHYMAPEQVESPGDVDHRADIYSLGVVFYEMLTGELPLGRFAPPSQKTPLDARVDEIVMRALAKERELRQQSAGEVQTQVEGLATAEGRAPASPGGEAPGATGSMANVAVPVLPARASRLAGWAVVGMALPLSILAVVALAGVWPDPSWNPGREELLVTLALWIGTPVTLLSGAGLLRHGRTARTEIRRGTVAAVEGLGFLAGLLCVGALFALSPHPAGLLAILVPPLAGLVLLVAAGWQRRPDGFAHPPAATRPAPASEYRSPRTLFGLPLLHVVRGVDPATGREREARGIVAIGGRATGVLAFGGLARGVFAFGGVAFGLFAFGGLAFGGAAVGGLALGLFSLGGLAVGLVLALGGIAAGWSGFGGLVAAQHGIGGFMAAGQRLPDTGLAGWLIRWLPWLWIPILPLSLVPGLVAAWAYRKLDPQPTGPRPNPWPHRLFWLVVLLVTVPTLAPMLMLLVPILHARAGGQVAALVIGSLLVLLGCGLWLGYRATRARLGEPALPANWNPWPKRVFLALLAVGVLPLMLLVIGLLLPYLWSVRSPGLPTLASPQVATGPANIQLIRVERRMGPETVILSWSLRSPSAAEARVSVGGRSATVPVPPTASGDGFETTINLLFQAAANRRGVLLTAGGGPDAQAWGLTVPMEGDATALLQQAESVAAGDLMLTLNTPVWIGFAGQEQVRLEVMPASQPAIGGLPETLPSGEPSPAALKWHHAWKRVREAEAKASVGVVSPGGPEMLAAERDLAVAESEFKQQPGIAARARLVYAEAILAITERMFANGRATEAEVDAARLAVAEAKAAQAAESPFRAPIRESQQP